VRHGVKWNFPGGCGAYLPSFVLGSYASSRSLLGVGCYRLPGVKIAYEGRNREWN